MAVRYHCRSGQPLCRPLPLRFLGAAPPASRGSRHHRLFRSSRLNPYRQPVSGSAARAGRQAHHSEPASCSSHRDSSRRTPESARPPRLLQFIGWQHAEAVLRSLAFACLNHDVKNTTPALSDEPADRPWRRNQKLVAGMGSAWMSGKVDDGATREMLAVLRQGTDEEACDKAVALIGSGISPQSIWDALFIAASEIVMRQPNVPNVHSMSSANALRYAFQASGDDVTRKLLILQDCAFITRFRDAVRGKVADLRIDDVKPLAVKESAGAIEEIFSDVSADHLNGAKKIHYYLSNGGSPQDLMNAARRLIFLKGRDAHDYKFSCAVLEDYFKVSPAWRNQFLAASSFYLKGSGEKDNVLVQRTRAAMKL